MVRFLVTEYCDIHENEEMYLEEHIPLEEGKTKADYIAAAWAKSKPRIETEAAEKEVLRAQFEIDLAAVEAARDEVDGSDIDPETGEVVVVEEEEEEEEEEEAEEEEE